MLNTHSERKKAHLREVLHYVFDSTNLSRLLLASMLLLSAGHGFGQAQPVAAYAAPDVSWHSANAKYIIGFEHFEKGAVGLLTASGSEVLFTSGTTTERIPAGELTGVHLGAEREEKGGVAGKVARVAIPYGGGSLLGVLSEQEVGLLTLDFHDVDGGLHSAVLLLPKSGASAAAQRLSLDTVPSTVAGRAASCAEGDSQRTIRISEIETEPQVALPAEYRAILYERLLSLPEKKTHTPHIFRIGDMSGQCAPLSLLLKVEGMSKGNAAVRASSGPIGLFAGVTSIRIHVLVTAHDGNVLLDSVEKGTRRGDKESLNAAVSVADKIGGDLQKAQKVAAKRR